MISHMVMKLMAKAPEDRYQSAGGLAHDLSRCEHHLNTEGDIPTFQIGQKDRVEHFLISEKLYGRDRQIETLLKSFDQAASGRTELMLVSGHSGIDKTAVINEIHKPIVHKRGYFIRGKFDQFNRSVPFHGFVQAFRELMAQILGEPQAEQHHFRKKILAVLGENAQVIIHMLPELERLTGAQPPVPVLSGTAAQNRFNLLFRKFIDIFTAKAHPLVIFLDDLQWADLASLQLLQLLKNEGQAGYLLFIGAYRDNEVSPAHPLSATIDAIRKAGNIISTLNLTPLHFEDVNHLIADTLDCSLELALPLTQLVYQRTQGNPFFCHQFLKALHAKGLLTFHEKANHWQCDLAQVGVLALNEDIIEFMAEQLQALPPGTQAALKLAACIGNRFDLETLAMVREHPIAQVAEDLRPALEEGLISPQHSMFTFAHGHETDTKPSSDFQGSIYRFLHDRVQQAAYSLIPAPERQSTHFKIGQLLLHHTPEEEVEAHIFDIVNQLNQGMALLTDSAAKVDVATLNLTAGKKAKSATAFDAAWDYFTVGRQLLPQDPWHTHYELTLPLYESSVEAAYLSGRFTDMEDLARTLFREAHQLIDTVKAYEVKIQALAAQNKLLEALHTGLHVLKLLGVAFPDPPGPEDIMAAVQETQTACQNKKIPDLIDLPMMTDPTQLSVIRILGQILGVAFISSPSHFVLLAAKAATVSVTYGNTPASTNAYAGYGIFLCGVAQDIETGCQFGQLALDLVQRLDAKGMESRVHLMVYSFITHWKRHVRESILPLQAAYYTGLSTGDFEFGGYSAYNYCLYAYFAGIEKDLAELERKVSSLSEALFNLKQMTVLHYFQMLQQALNDMRQGRKDVRYLKGACYDEEAMLPVHLKANDRVGLFFLNFHKLLLNYLFEDYDQACQNADQVETYLDGGTGYPMIPIFYFYDSLARISVYRETPDTVPDELLTRIEANQSKLAAWARHAPMKCAYKFDLVEAERMRVAGDKAAAMDLYDQAISGAKENGYLRDEALANELTAKFYLGWHKDKVAQAYMQSAHQGYLKWGGSIQSKTTETQLPIAAARIHHANRHGGQKPPSPPPPHHRQYIPGSSHGGQGLPGDCKGNRT